MYMETKVKLLPPDFDDYQAEIIKDVCCLK